MARTSVYPVLPTGARPGLCRRGHRSAVTAGTREGALERPRLQHAEQLVDVAADEAITVVLHRPDMGRCPERDPGGLTGDMVVSPDETTKPLGQRVDQ